MSPSPSVTSARPAPPAPIEDCTRAALQLLRDNLTLWTSDQEVEG